MARLRFEINGKKGAVAFDTFAAATTSFLGLLKEIGGAVPSGHDGRLTWYVDDLSANGSLAVEIHSQVRNRRQRQKGMPRDFSQSVTANLIQGLENIEVYGVSPPYLSEVGLQKMNRLLGLLNKNGAEGFTAKIPESARGVQVGHEAVRNLAKLLPTRRTEKGSIEGRIETISIHGRSRFVVYDAITKKGVTCHIDETKVSVTDAKEALGRKVLVSGAVSFNERGEPVSLKATHLRVFRRFDELPKAVELAGSDPDFTGEMSTEEFLRGIRSG